MKKSIVLPSNVTELRNAIVTAIEFYQKSPAINENKINEALAKVLGFDNFNQLSPLMPQTKTKPIAASIESKLSENGHYNCSFTEINGIEINDIIFDEEMIDYRLIERDDFTLELYRWISEANEHDRTLMIQDLDYLRSLNDEYVFSSISTNKYISPTMDTELFNEICTKILDIQGTL